MCSLQTALFSLQLESFDPQSNPYHNDFIYHQWIHLFNTVKLPPNPHDACQWLGVTCVNGVVHTINWKRVSLASLCWLPPYLKNVHITKNNIPLFLKTAMLPRELLNCNLENNLISGTIDVNCLPRNLETLSVRENNFSGRLFISNLPPSLKIMRIDYNFYMSRVVVDIAFLPPDLVRIEIYVPLKRRSDAKMVFWPKHAKDNRVQFHDDYKRLW